jgi:tripartite-type tricarboxylate transporter receptor subunit TctC
MLRMASLVVLFAVGTCSAQAQTDYPNRMVRIVVPATPGGGTDLFARMIAQHLSATLGQQFVVDNKPGGGALVGMDFVHNSPADGYTLFLSPSTLTSMHVVRKTMPYDVTKAFSGVTKLAVTPQALVITPSLPTQSVQDFIALAKREPGKLTYGTSGPGTAPHMAIELLKSMTGIDLQHIPYRGVSQAVTDIIGGRVSGMVLNLVIAKPLLDNGQLRALGVTSLKRSETRPDIPAIAETVPGYEALQWFGVLVAAGTPKPIIDLLQRTIAEGFKSPEIQQRLADAGAEAVVSTPDLFDADIKAEKEKWTAVAKAANIKPEE